MSVLFLPPSAGAASVPDASETVSGKIRIATSAEATTGTNDLTAMTPAKVKSVVDAAVVGGVTYQGTFDTSSPVDLSNALKGDMYVISVAGTYQGIVWAVGDHLLINEDMGGTISPSKIDKVDNTDAVTSVAGKTGAVTLVPADVTGLATVASTGAYSDLSGTPTLGTAAAEDVGSAAGNVVQLDGSARLPAVDGSQLTNLPSGATTLGALTDVDVTGAVNTNVIKYNATSGDWEDGAVAYSEVTGTPTLATVATTGAYSDLSGQPIIRNQTSGSVIISAPSSPAIISHVNIPLAVSQSVGLPASSVAIAGTQITIHNGSTVYSTDVTAQGGDLIRRGTGAAATTFTLEPRHSVTVSYVASGSGVVLFVTGFDTGLDVGTAANNLVKLDGSARLPSVDGSQLLNLPSGSTTLNGLSDVSAASPNNGDVIAYNSTSGDWEAVTVSVSKPPVTVASPSADVTLTAPVTTEEVYAYTPSTDITVNLVSAVTCGVGFRYYIKNLSTNTITVDPNSTQTIDGSSDFTLNVQYSSISLISDGSNWFIF